MFIFFDARMSFARTLTVLLFMFCTGFAETTENDVCDFDDSLAILLIRSVHSHTSYSEVLDYILQDSLSVNHEICKDEYKVQAISAKVKGLFNTSKTAKNVKVDDIAYTKYEHFSGKERRRSCIESIYVTPVIISSLGGSCLRASSFRICSTW